MNDDHLRSKNSSSSGQPVETLSSRGQIEDRDTEYKLLLNLSDAYTKMGQWVHAVEALESARLIALALGDKSHQASVLIRLGDVNLALQKNDEAIKHYTAAASIFCETGNKRGEANTLVTIGYVHYCSANWHDAAQWFNRALQILMQLDDERFLSSTLTILGETHRHLREYDSAIVLLKRAMEIHESLGDLPSSALTLTSIGNVYCEIGRQAESLRSFELASQYFLELGDFRNAAVMLVRYRAALKVRGMEPGSVENSGAVLKTFSRVDDPTADFFSGQIARHRQTPSIASESEPLPTAANPAKDLDLASFTCETITVNDLGKVKKRRKITARHFIQELAPGISLEMVEIPGGTFTMGAPENEECSLNCERPQHEISLSPFYIGKFTITQAQWRVVASWSRVWRRLNPAPSRFKGDDRPVERVSWFDALEFCARLTVKTGRVWRLPTEAEWEYACRAGTNTPFAFGETLTHEISNYYSEYPYAKARKHEPRNQTIPVGSLGKANAFGLFDMHGNTREWCRDWYGDYPAAPQTNPRGPAKGTCRVVRGGSWYANAYNCRSAARIGLTPELRNDTVSFRIALSNASHTQSRDGFAG